MSGSLLGLEGIPQVALWSSLVLCAALGLTAIISPRKFSLLSMRGSRWIDTNKVAEVLDKRIDVDHHVLPFSRLLGIVVVTAVGVLAYVIVRY